MPDDVKPTGKITDEIFGLYRHFRGDVYYVMGCARDVTQNTEQPIVVIYRAITGLNLYVRPLANFLEVIEYAGDKIQRFTKIEDLT